MSETRNNRIFDAGVRVFEGRRCKAGVKDVKGEVMAVSSA